MNRPFSRLAALIVAALSLTPLVAQPPVPMPDEPAPEAYIASILRDCDIREVAPTGSMKPSIDERDWVVIAPPHVKPFSEVKAGQVIVYLRSDKVLICHRVWTVSSGHSLALCWGDANSVRDEEMVTAKTYRGTVVMVVRRPGL